MRTELDDDDAVVLVRQIRQEVRREVEGIQADEGVDLEATWGVNPAAAAASGGPGAGKGAVKDREKL